MTLSAAVGFFRPALFRASVSLTGLLVLAGLRAQDFSLESAGARFGFPFDQHSESFRQAEAFANWNLPWHGVFCSNWRLESRLELASGWLQGHGDDAFVGSFGSSMVLRYADFPLSLAGGTSPTYISRHEFGPTDLGSLIEFTSHADLNWEIGPHMQLGYRFQHMSNAGISSHNPGLNLHMFTVGFRF